MIKDISIPDGFKAIMSAEMGNERAENLFSALNGEPEISLRINRRKQIEFPIYEDMTPVPWCVSGKYLSSRPFFTLNPLLHAGAFYVQEASSMVYETIVSVIRDQLSDNSQKSEELRICDLCASPGGKTTAILNALPDGSVILANEFLSSRASILKENLLKYGYPDMLVTNTNTSRLSSMRCCFDLVVVDAPCSGEGMMRKDETARTQWSEGLIHQCATLQREILENAEAMLAPGGYIIYSTCTFNTIENEDNAAWIADTLGLTPVETGLAGKFGIQPQLKGDIPCLRFMPGFTRGEGLFASVFKKENDGFSQRTKLKRNSNRKNKDRNKDKTDPKILELAKSWIKGEMEILNHDGHLLALTPDTAALLEHIPKGIRIVSAGVEIGEIKGKDLIPSHSLAMSVAMSHPFPEVELSEKEALQFLAREALQFSSDVPKGYMTVTYKGLPLGFVKNHGTRANNLYPPEYRIKCLTHNA